MNYLKDTSIFDRNQVDGQKPVTHQYNDCDNCPANALMLGILTQPNDKLDRTMRNLDGIYRVSCPAFKDDLGEYAALYHDQVAPYLLAEPSPYSIFLKMMFAFARLNQGFIDLEDITINDIQAVFNELLTVENAVENEFLPYVDGYEGLSAGI